MNKIQESFYKIIVQYVKETYTNDATLKYLIDGIDNFTDKNIQTEVENKRPSFATPLPQSIIDEKERIKTIMNKVLDVNFKPSGIYTRHGDIISEDIKTPTDNKNVIEELRKFITPIDNHPDRVEEELEKIPKEDISNLIENKD